MQVLEENEVTIQKYLKSYRNEVNASTSTLITPKYALRSLSKHNNYKPFIAMTEEDVQDYLNILRKSEAQGDSMHRWIGTYNIYLTHLIRFFKWLHYPEYSSSERFKPKCVMNLKKLPRREKSIYKPSDLWTAEDDLLFLKYCPSKRIKCYHMIARDSSCRPHEILRLKTKSLVFKSVDSKQYAEILVNGKTGTRHIPLINSIPYIKEYLMSDHPMPTNPNAALISGIGKSLGKHLSTIVISVIYKEYKKKYYPKLLEDNSPASKEDKNAISELLKKPWNPYIRRHSALTDKSKYLKESVLKQHAGWTSLSNMPEIYLHYFGNESSESILEAYGLKPKAEEIDKMKPKQCPNCNEQNKLDSKFCAKCRMVLTYDAYSETVEEKQHQDDALSTLSDQIMKLTAEVQELKNKS